MPNYISNKTIEKLKYDLVRNNLVSYDDLQRAEEISRTNNINLSQVLIEEDFISEEKLLNFIQENLRIPYVNLEDYSIDEKCLSFVSVTDAEKYKILPLFRIENVLTIAMADPLDLFAVNNLVKCAKCDIEPVICSERLILQFIKKHYELTSGEKVKPQDSLKIDWRDELNEETPDNLQSQRIINSIISQALFEKAFEIIFENTDEGLIVKFKNTEQTQNKGVIPLLLSPLCVSRLKQLCNLDTNISGLPQLGKFSYSAEEECITGVVATFPLVKGERINIKLYYPPKTLKNLSLREKHREIISGSLQKPGIIFIIGPELSGKSFIAYSLLNSMDRENKNIMTVESIVKYRLNGINQSELNEKTGLDAEKALKLIGFQSPDCIYIEEIISGKLTDYIINMAKSGKLVITEINAQKHQDIADIFVSNEFNELKNLVNCVVSVSDTENIVVFETME